MYLSASTSALLHILVVTVGLLGWPALDLVFDQKFGRGETRDVLSYEESSDDFQARYQPGALTDDPVETDQHETTSGIDPDDSLDTMSSGEVGFDEPGDGRQDSTRAGQPAAIDLPLAAMGSDGTGKDRGEESASDGEREDGGGAGDSETAGATMREIVIFVDLRLEPQPDEAPVESEMQAEAGPADSPAATAIETDGEKPGELAALMSGEPTPEKAAPRGGAPEGLAEGETGEGRKSEIEATRAAGPNPGDPSPPDLPDMPKAQMEGASAPDAPLAEVQSLAPAVAAAARRQGEKIAGLANTSDETEIAATASGRPGRADVVDSPTEDPTPTDAMEPQPELRQTVPNKGVPGLDTPAPLREDHIGIAREATGAGLPNIGGRLSGLSEALEGPRGAQNDVVQPESRLNAGSPEARADLSDSETVVTGGAVGSADAAASAAATAETGVQLAALPRGEPYLAPITSDTDRAALMPGPSDPLAQVFAAVAGNDERLARALRSPLVPDAAIGGTPAPGALKTNLLLEQAAEAGLAKAQLELAKRYIVGLVDGRDPERLIELLRNAAERGEVEAQLLLGALFADGRIVARDLIQSHVFFDLAAAQGSIEAKDVLPVVERQMAPREIVDSRRLAREYSYLLQALPRPQAHGDLGDGLRQELLDAAAAGNTARIAELLARGADLEGSDTSGRTAVINAAWRGREEVVDLLVELGADFNVTDYEGRTALSWAASNGHASIVDKLLGAGAETDIADSQGLTPLMRAAWNGHEDIVRRLIDAGARLSDSDGEGHTALDYAIRGGHGEIARILKSFGA